MFVEPPWKGAPPACRGCGIVHSVARAEMKWAAATIVHLDKPAKILRWTMGSFCERCVRDERVKQRVSIDVFLPGTPPGPHLEKAPGIPVH